MKQYYLNVHSMQKSVLTLMDENKEKWEGVAAITESVAYIRPRVNAIGQAAKGQQEHNTEGYTEAKEAAFDVMTGQAYKLGLRLKIFARKTGRVELIPSVDFSKSEIAAGSGEEVINRCVIIAGIAATHETEVAAYNVKPGDLAALNAAIETARPKSTERDLVGVKRTEATASIPVLFKEVNAKLVELDEEVEGLLDDEAFLSLYTIARRVNNHNEALHPKEAAEPVK